MDQQNSFTIAKTYRSIGWTGIASGVIGLLAYAFLLTAVLSRSTMALSAHVYLMFRTHDVCIILQFLLLIPVTWALYKLSHQNTPGVSRLTLNTGIGALSFIVIILLLVFPRFLPDDYYPIPQGIFGACLIIINRRMKGLLSPGLRRFGTIVGIGLIIFGIGPLAYAILINPIIFRIPAIDPANIPDNNSITNTVLHIFVWIGSFMGIITLPFWTIQIGRRLLREKSN